MSTPVAAAPLAGYNDRRVGCIVFGAIESVIGVVCLLTIPLLLLLASLTPSGANYRERISIVVTCVLAATAFVWLGIGSILCRRWARTLLLILAWSWLVAGVTSIAVLGIVLPQMLERLAPGTAGLVVGLVVLCVVALFLVVVPGAMILFYRGRHVQATFEARDPRPRWTDACPLPVLTTALWFALGAISVLPAVAGGSAVVPLFGQLVSGLPATLVLLGSAGISLWLAWGFVRLERAALWVSLALTLLAGVSATVTFAQVDFLEIYRLMGYPQEQIDAIREMGLLGGQTMPWLMALLGIATCAFLVWLKKYFPVPRSSATT